MTLRNARQLCVICGADVATTSDHVPPKAIFPKPRPNDLVTVPSCFRCNNTGSKYDEEFRVFLGLQLGMETPITQKLWKKNALKTLKHNRRLQKHIVEKSWDVDFTSPTGVYLGKRRAVSMPVHPHNSVLDRTVRGLYFHHFGEILGSRVSCKVSPLNGLPQEISSILNMMAFGSMGDDAFCYRYGRATDSPHDSLWLLLFYNKLLVMVETRSKRRAIMVEAVYP